MPDKEESPSLKLKLSLVIDKSFFVSALPDEFLLLGRLLVNITLNKFDIDQNKSLIVDCFDELNYLRRCLVTRVGHDELACAFILHYLATHR